MGRFKRAQLLLKCHCSSIHHTVWQMDRPKGFPAGKPSYSRKKQGSRTHMWVFPEMLLKFQAGFSSSCAPQAECGKGYFQFLNLPV